MAKNMSKSAQRKEVKQKRDRLTALEDDAALFGRVIKALGNRQFRVVVPNSKKQLMEVIAKIPKARVRIGLNDIVVLGHDEFHNFEIQCPMSGKDASRLHKERRLHPALLLGGEWDTEKAKKIEMKEPEDEGFEFDYEGMEETGFSDDEVDKQKMAAAGDEEFDIDDI
jgi:translation initiation factor IF-1